LRPHHLGFFFVVVGGEAVMPLVMAMGVVMMMATATMM
jgi:hypothetical protein